MLRELIARSIRSSDSRVVAKLAEKKRRKLAKLVKTPELFVRDAVEKLLRKGDVAALGAYSRSHRQDFVTNVKPHMDQLLAHLQERQISLQKVDYGPVNRHNVLVDGDQLADLLATLKSYDCAPFQLRIVPAPSQIRRGYRGKIQLSLVSGDVEYCNPCVVLDPWYHRGNWIATRNTGAPVTLVEESFLCRTVCAAPRPRRADTHDNPGRPPSFEESLQLSKPIYDFIPFPIDLVYTWVDGGDDAWAAKKNKWMGHSNHESHASDTGDERYRDRGELRYSLRSAASHFKSARKIFLVTDQQVPGWLDTDHPQLTVIDHREIFRSDSELPTFNSHAIEANIHRIPGLAEHFLYLNDDCFFWNDCEITDFFFANGISKAFPEKQRRVYGETSPVNEGFKNAALNVNRLLRASYGRSAYSFNLHTPISLRKSTLTAMWQAFPAPLDETSHSKFRHQNDISPVSFLYQAFAFLRGEAVPSEISHQLVMSTHPALEEQLRLLGKDYETKTACFSDSGCTSDSVEEALAACLAERFSVAAAWELSH